MSPWWWRLSKLGRAHAASLATIVLLAAGSAALNALKPWPLKLIIDNVLADEPLPAWTAWLQALPAAGTSLHLIAWLAAASLLIVLAAEGLTLIRNYIQAGVGSRMNLELGGRLFNHLQRLSLLFHYRKPTGDLVRRITTDAMCAQDLLIGVYVPALTAVANLAVMAVILWRLAPGLALIGFAVAIPLALAIRLFSDRMTTRSYAQQEEEGRLATMAERTLTALPIVQAFGREDAEVSQYSAATGSALTAHLRATATQVQFSAMVTSMTALGTAAVLGVGGLQVVEHDLTLGTLVVALAYLLSVYTPLETLVFLSGGFYAAGARARRVFEILDHAETIVEPATPKAFPGVRAIGEVRFDHVSFGYDTGTPVLKEVDLEVSAGESVALVGPTGAGKTSIASLLLRLYDPWEGTISIDGVDAREVAVADWRAQIAFVPQEPLILPVSVWENIAYGRPDATAEEVIAAARAAQCEAFIKNLAEGYDTVVGERGATLSGGEKQRLSLARAYLRDAPILILDEPTSSLDAETEAEIVKALETVSKGRTTFIIAHRLSTVRHVAQVCFIEDGRVAESGTYQELMSKRARFWKFQHMSDQARSD